ncbi:MAG: LCP family protein [Clostridia bacterium]|nr:LCP family protein [Clostridia bacterium]MBR6787873.1 LCP family protein [Clostridia bacterium]
MSKRTVRRSRRANPLRICLALCGVFAVLVLGALLSRSFEAWHSAPIENAGRRMTAYTKAREGAQVFMNGRWHVGRDLDTLLVIGVDDFGAMTGSQSYNNSSQADFLALFIRDQDTGEKSVLHLNRDAMTNIPVLGLTGQKAGTTYGQLALAFNYGRGQEDSCQNVVDAVSHLLFGVEIDHYIAVTMDAVPIMNDWAGGVEVEVKDDFTGIDDTLKLGSMVKLQGDRALTYVRTRRGLEDSSNLHRMERQRQYATAWMQQAQPYLQDPKAVAELVVSLGDYHFTDYTVEEFIQFGDMLTDNGKLMSYELPGENVLGRVFMEYHVDDAALADMVLNLFYLPIYE